MKNVELVQWIDHAIATRPGPVRFRWVRGHVGNYYNEQADKLAGEAARAAAGRADATPNGIDDLPPLPTAVRPPAAVTETMSDTAATTPLTVVVTDKPASRPKRGRATAETADALTLF